MPRVASVETLELDDPIDVFDIQVEHDHSFIVADAVLHNSELCRAYSGLSWDLDGNPLGHRLPFNGGPPRHWRCRSVLVALLKDIDDIPAGKARRVPDATRASMDGQVPSDMTYDEWLRTKSKQFQIDVMGRGKWELWNRGFISQVDLLDQSGNPLTLAELRDRLGL